MRFDELYQFRHALASVHGGQFQILQYISQRHGLLAVAELFQVAELHSVVVQGELAGPGCFQLYPVVLFEGDVRAWATPGVNGRKSRLCGGEDRKICGCSFGFLSDIHWHIFLHLNDTVGHREIGTGAPCHNDGGDAKVLIETANPFNKRNDGFFFGRNYLLHQLIPNHEIGGGGVLVDKKQLTATLNTFHQIGSLRGTSAGVLGRKISGIFLTGQLPDKRRNVHMGHAAAIFRAQLPGAFIGNDQFPAVALNVIIDAILQRLQHRGFAVIAAAYKERNTLRNPHATDFSAVRQRKRHFHGSRGAE